MPILHKYLPVYALISEVNADIYVGIAKDADQRLKMSIISERTVYKRIKTPGKIYIGNCNPIGRLQEKEKNILNQE